MKSKTTKFIGKKAFTLLEVVISITIFMIILIFLYKVLDDTKISNNKFVEHIEKSNSNNHFYKILTEDIAESIGNITISQDKDENNIVIFKSNNSFNNPYYTNIAYMITSENSFARIESLNKFQKGKSGIEFYKNSFIDILLKDIKKFTVLTKDDKIVFIVEVNNKEKIMFSTFKMMED